MNIIKKPASAEQIFVAYTGGSCLENSGPGGCAYLLHPTAGGIPAEYSRGETNTTCNRVEMQAVIELLKRTPRSTGLLVYLTSNYVREGLEINVRRWRVNRRAKLTP